MGIFSGLRRLFGGGSSGSSGDRGRYYYVRCKRCKETIRFRVDPQWDLGTADGGGYTVNKYIVGQKCFRPIEVTLTFDDNREETERSISGGSFISEAEFAQEQV